MPMCFTALKCASPDRCPFSTAGRLASSISHCFMAVGDIGKCGRWSGSIDFLYVLQVYVFFVQKLRPIPGRGVALVGLDAEGHDELTLGLFLRGTHFSGASFRLKGSGYFCLGMCWME